MDSKKVYVWSLPLTPEVILSFVSSQVASLMQSYKEHELYQYVTTVITPLVILYMNARSFVDLGLPLPLLNFLPAKNVWIYIETAIVVVISYVSLLIVSWSYIWLVVFPIIAIGFIVALCNKLSHQDQAAGSHSQEQSNKGEGEATEPAGKKGEGLEAVALVPYWALCMMGHFHADKFTVSQFLLFFSFMLGALTMMMTRLVGLATVHRGIAPASELLRKASLVVLLVAVHAVAAELLGENALLFCLPEIVPVLLWLSFRLDYDDRAIIITGTAADRIKLDLGRVLNLLGAAAAAVLSAILVPGNMEDSVLYWCSKAMVSCAVSALLTLCIVFMLCQWPGGQRDGTLVTVTGASLQEAVELLKYSFRPKKNDVLAINLDMHMSRFIAKTCMSMFIAKTSFFLGRREYWANVLLAAVATLLVFTSLASFQLVLLQPVASGSADQIPQRLCQKFLQFII